jgi:hypothetical protein
MTLNEKVLEDLQSAMKARDEVRVSCLRMLRASLKNKQVEKGRELKDEEGQAVISSSVRKCKEAVEEFRKGEREDLALREEQQINILYEYMPRQLTKEEIEKTLREIISEMSAKSSNDLGKVMKEAMAGMSGRAQGKDVSEIARKLLS